MPGGEMTITVVDNASSDGTVELLRRDFPEAEVIEVEANLGFARGANRGAARRRPGTAWLLLLNPDVRLDPGSLRLLVAVAERIPSAGIYGGQARDESGKQRAVSLAEPSLRQALAWAVRIRSVRPLRWLDPDVTRPEAGPRVRSVPVLIGSLVLIDTRLWEQLGGFDETFVQYGEDVDLCLRARRRGGTPVYYGGSRYVHLGGASVQPTERTLLVLRGKVELYQRYLTPLRGVLAVSALKAGVAARAALASRSATDWNAVWSTRAKWTSGFSRNSDPRVALVSGRSIGCR